MIDNSSDDAYESFTSVGNEHLPEGDLDPVYTVFPLERDEHILAVVNETFRLDEDDEYDFDDDSFDEEDDDTDDEELFLFPTGPMRLEECEVCLQDGLLKLRPCCDSPICDDCMVKYLENKAAMAMVQIQCPNPRCQKYVGREEIVARLTGTLREQFRQHLIDANRDPYIKTCPGCNHITKMTRQDLKVSYKVDCVKCEQAWCFKCHAIWHNGITCSRYQQGEKLLKKWAKNAPKGQVNAQKCPRCKFYIERISGCDVMTCSRCYTEFCYSCGGRFHSLGLFGNHHSRFSIVGCRNRLFAKHPVPRRLVRGSLFGLALLAAPVVGTLGFVAGLVALPVYGSYKLYKKIRRRRRSKRCSSDSFDISDLLDLELGYHPTGDEDDDADLLLRTLIRAHLGTTVRDSTRLYRPQNQRTDSYLLKASSKSTTESNSRSLCEGDHVLRKVHSCSCLVGLTGELESDVASDVESDVICDDEISELLYSESSDTDVSESSYTDVPRESFRKRRSHSFDSSWNKWNKRKNEELRKMYIDTNDLVLNENNFVEKSADDEPDIQITRL